MNRPSNSAISSGLFLAVILWGANNAATKFLIQFWPPIFIGCSRFALAGLVLLALLRWTKIFGTPSVLPRELKRQLWLRGGIHLALYIVAFNWALKLTSVAHVALYLGASPVWALFWEGRPDKTWKSFQRYFAAALALCGVLVLFWPARHSGSSHLLGELFGLSCSILWTSYGRQCRALAQHMSGAEVSACTFWRAGVLLAPLAIFEVAMKPVIWRTDLVLVQLFSVLASGVVAFAIWNNALRYWSTSKVYLFNNLIPLTTMSWAYVFFGEKITSTFWVAMILIVAGVLIGQTRWQGLFGQRRFPGE